MDAYIKSTLLRVLYQTISNWCYALALLSIWSGVSSRVWWDAIFGMVLTVSCVGTYMAWYPPFVGHFYRLFQGNIPKWGIQTITILGHIVLCSIIYLYRPRNLRGSPHVVLSYLIALAIYGIYRLWYNPADIYGIQDPLHLYVYPFAWLALFVFYLGGL